MKIFTAHPPTQAKNTIVIWGGITCIIYNSWGCVSFVRFQSFIKINQFQRIFTRNNAKLYF
jgi:hypothetical protein